MEGNYQNTRAMFTSNLLIFLSGSVFLVSAFFKIPQLLNATDAGEFWILCIFLFEVITPIAILTLRRWWDNSLLQTIFAGFFFVFLLIHLLVYFQVLETCGCSGRVQLNSNWMILGCVFMLFGLTLNKVWKHQSLNTHLIQISLALAGAAIFIGQFIGIQKKSAQIVDICQFVGRPVPFSSESKSVQSLLNDSDVVILNSGCEHCCDWTKEKTGEDPRESIPAGSYFAVITQRGQPAVFPIELEPSAILAFPAWAVTRNNIIESCENFSF